MLGRTGNVASSPRTAKHSVATLSCLLCINNTHKTREDEPFLLRKLATPRNRETGSITRDEYSARLRASVGVTRSSSSPVISCALGGGNSAAIRECTTILGFGDDFTISQDTKCVHMMLSQCASETFQVLSPCFFSNRHISLLELTEVLFTYIVSIIIFYIISRLWINIMICALRAKINIITYNKYQDIWANYY